VCPVGIRFAIVEVSQGGAVDHPIGLYGVEQPFERTALEQIGLQDLEGGIMEKVAVGNSDYFVLSGGAESQIQAQQP
jgi:hypothetical protein